MRAPGVRWVSVAGALVASVASSVTARAQDGAMMWDAPCGDRAGFVRGVEELGGSFDGFDVQVAVGAGAVGYHGRLTIQRGEELLAVRELEDPLCTDVVDALVIAAALALRSLPPPPAEGSTLADPAVTAPLVTPDPVAEPVATAPAQAPVAAGPPPEPAGGEPLRVALGASLRGGLGSTPGAALAPGLVLALQLDRLLAALSLAFWPDAGAAVDGTSRGVSLWALSTTVEVGYRIGDALSVVPCVVLEPSVAFARGVGVERARERASFVLDGGLAVWVTLDLADRVRLFARGDLLFGAVRPAYGVEGEIVFAGPVARGTGGAGVLVLF